MNYGAIAQLAWEANRLYNKEKRDEDLLSWAELDPQLQTVQVEGVARLHSEGNPAPSPGIDNYEFRLILHQVIGGFQAYEDKVRREAETLETLEEQIQ